MEDSKEFYKTLGLKPGASIDEVKKAYKKKQFELHPSGPARRKIRDSAEYKALNDEQKAAKDAKLDEEASKVNVAYTVLSDENKKKDYDTGAGDYAQFPDMDGFSGFGDIFSHFGGGRRQTKNKAKNVECEVRVDYKDIFLGKTCKFRVKSQKVCKPCNGKGSKDTTNCSRCKGSGTVVQRVNLGIMVTSMQVECPDCRGLGYSAKGPVCSDCKGERIVSDSRIVELVIPAGHQDGVPIAFKGQGNEYPGYVAGDLVFKITVNEVQGCERVGNDFVCIVEVDILTALAGGVIYYEHLDGRKLAVKVSPIKNFDSSIVVPGEGFAGQRGKKGNLYLKPKILVNPGLDRSRLSEYLKPLLSKPQGEFVNVNSTFGMAPEQEDDEQSEYGHHGGFNQSDFFRFF